MRDNWGHRPIRSSPCRIRERRSGRIGVGIVRCGGVVGGLFLRSLWGEVGRIRLYLGGALFR